MRTNLEKQFPSNQYGLGWLVVGLGVIAAIYLMREDRPLGHDRRRVEVPERTTHRQSRGEDQRDHPEGRDRAVHERLRADLAKLKASWLEAKNSDDTSRLATLARDSADQLSCSNELFELLEYLDEIGLRSSIERVLQWVNRQFGGDDAAAARKLLCGLKVLPYRRYWSYAAALDCPDDEVEGFIRALGDPAARNTARVARAECLSRTDPFRALSEALAYLPPNLTDGTTEGAAVDPSYRLAQVAPEEDLAGALGRIVKNAPKGTDMAMLERALPVPAGRKSGSPLGRAQRGLFYQWARSDLAAATQYVLANRDRCPPDVMLMVDPHTIGLASSLPPADWVLANLPEGPYFDAAVEGMMNGWNEVTPDVYFRLVERISDGNLKSRMMTRDFKMTE